MYLIPLMFWWDHSHSRKHVFHLSVYCFIHSTPDDCSLSVSTTLGYNTLASEGVYPFEPSSLVWLWKEAGCSHHHMRLNGPVCESFRSVSFFFLLPVLGVSSSPSLSDCCSCGAEPPAVTRPEGQPASFSEKERKKKKRKKKRGVKINFSLNKFVKAASKGVQHLLWHSCPAWCDLENATRHLTNSVAWLLRKKVLFCLTLDW